MRKSILLPLRHGWSIHASVGALDNNHHIYRRGKFGPHFGTRRKGFNLVEMGLLKDTLYQHDEVRRRICWGWRLWRYRRDGSCWSIDATLHRPREFSPSPPTSR